MEIKINEKLMVEELHSLNEGKTINFIEGEYCGVDIVVKIQGVNIKPNNKIMESECKQHKITMEKREALRDNILERYDNSEYWEEDILNNPDFEEVKK